MHASRREMSTRSDEHGPQAHGHAPRFERRHHAGKRGQARAEATEVIVALESRQTPVEKEDSPCLLYTSDAADE